MARIFTDLLVEYPIDKLRVTIEKVETQYAKQVEAGQADDEYDELDDEDDEDDEEGGEDKEASGRFRATPKKPSRGTKTRSPSAKAKAKPAPAAASSSRALPNAGVGGVLTCLRFVESSVWV